MFYVHIEQTSRTDQYKILNSSLVVLESCSLNPIFQLWPFAAFDVIECYCGIENLNSIPPYNCNARSKAYSLWLLKVVDQHYVPFIFLKNSITWS